MKVKTARIVVRSTKNEIREVLNKLNYNSFKDVANDKTGRAKEKHIENDLQYIFNSIAKSENFTKKTKINSDFIIFLEIGAIVTNKITADGFVAIMWPYCCEED